MRALSPVSLVAFCWLASFAIAGLALSQPDRFDLLPILMGREELSMAAFAPIGLAWLMLAALVLFTGDYACRWSLPPPRPFQAGIALARAARLVFWCNLALLGVTGLWVVLTAAKVGGMAQLAAIAMLDTLTARDLLLNNKLFTGMRLFYAALPATGCLAAAILTAGRGRLPARARILCFAVLAMNTAALAILPIVMSQRLLLLQFLLSAYLVSCLIRGRIFGLAWVTLGIALFLMVWILRESLTNPLLYRSGVDIGMQKLAFYFVNDLWNSFAPLQSDAPAALGAVSLRGLMFLTFSDGLFERLLAERIAALDEIRGGGDFSLFTAPYVDFGPFGAALFLLLAGFVFRLAFHKGRQNLVWAAIYAQIGAALLFSTHGLYVLHQNFLFSLALIVLLMRFARPRSAATPMPYPSTLPDTILRQVLLFKSRRSKPVRQPAPATPEREAEHA
jgi:oligosaccharide repeat unit polymerase